MEQSHLIVRILNKAAPVPCAHISLGISIKYCDSRPYIVDSWICVVSSPMIPTYMGPQAQRRFLSSCLCKRRTSLKHEQRWQNMPRHFQIALWTSEQVHRIAASKRPIAPLDLYIKNQMLNLRLARTHAHTHTHTHAHTHTHTHTHTCTHTHIHTYIYTHTHTHTQIDTYTQTRTHKHNSPAWKWP